MATYSCPKCGYSAELPEGRHTCLYCGTMMTSSLSKSPVGAEENTEKKIVRDVASVRTKIINALTDEGDAAIIYRRILDDVRNFELTRLGRIVNEILQDELKHQKALKEYLDWSEM